MSATPDPSNRGAALGKIRCPMCGAEDYSTDAVCLRCGADLDLARAAMRPLSDVPGAAPADGQPDSLAGLASDNHRQVPAALLIAAGALLMMRYSCGPDLVPVIFQLMLGASAVFLCIAVALVLTPLRPVYSLVARPCRSKLGWLILVGLLPLSFLASLVWAVTEVQNQHALAVHGRTGILEGRVMGKKRLTGSIKGVPYTVYALNVEFDMGGRLTHDQLRFPSTVYDTAMVGAPYRQFVDYLPSNPAVHRFDHVDARYLDQCATRDGIAWAMVISYLTAGIGLLCYYARPL